MKIFIDFKIGEPPYVYQDTLILTEEEYASLTPEQIEDMKIKRYENWYSIITSPSPEMVEIDFEIGEPPYVYQDTLVLTKEEYASLTPEQIEDMKIERYENWYSIVTATSRTEA